ncbi:hypothetical protein CLV33_102392 [Jejuia pallidilutea]|uniref:Uncharacterized protein n=1 Tax=Jejuia pallidilutea TaxID=504487 RepID=A0A362XCP0_9FLAO|nr:hypothetical protein [Jejuia pallidilutea]PQV50528.1 hypothetical protein CLV33_102392 [Jejuia pallidilutea]
MKTKVFLAIILLTIYSCRKEKLINVKIYTLYESTEKPRIGLETRIYEIKKPIFGMWEFHERQRMKTDSIGVVQFQLKKGQYSVRFYYNEKFLYSTDDLPIEDSNTQNFILKW